MLPIAPSTYYAHKSKIPSERELRDQELKPEIYRVWEESMCRYGADKVWKQLLREGFSVARCTVERLMKKLGIQGIRRGAFKVTTSSNIVFGWQILPMLPSGQALFMLPSSSMLMRAGLLDGTCLDA